MFCFQNCKKRNSEYFLNKYQSALKKQKDNLSEYYIHKSYEYSLAKSFFPLQRKQYFTKLKIAKLYPMITVLQKDKRGKFKKIFFYDTIQKKYSKMNIQKNLLSYKISPKALYAVLLYYTEDRCYFNVIDIQKRKKIFDGYEDHYFIDCFQSMAVSDIPNVFFAEDNTIYKFDILSKKEKKMLVKSKFKKFLKNVPHKTNIECLNDNLLFITIGNLGVYKLYKVKQNTKWLIDRTVAKDKIYFTRENLNPIVHRGKAGGYSFAIYDKDNNRLLKTIKKSKEDIQDIFAIDKDTYFYTVDNLIVKKDNKEEKELPFLSSNIVALSTVQLFFLTKIGSFIEYNNEEFSPDNIKIFQLVREISD